MNTKYFKNIFFITIFLLVVAGIYIVYLKDNNKQNSVQARNKELQISHEISIGISNFDTINPILTKNLEIQHITKLIYEPLINITKDFNEEPCIAEEWSKIDELTYIIKLNENKKWHNGEAVKIEDIEFSINTIRDSNSIYKENVEQIDVIEKINLNTFKIHLKEPVSFFEYLLCFPILQENTIMTQIPLGTGKFKITSMENEQIIVQGEKIKLILKIFKNTTELYNQFTRENVDIIITENTDYEKYIGNIGFEEKVIPGREWVYISCDNIENETERKELNYSINKERIVYDLYNKKYIVADFPLAYGSYLNSEKKENYEPSGKLNKTYTLSTNEENKKIAQEIKGQFEEKGIKIYIQNYRNPKADLILKQETISIKPTIAKYFNNEDEKNRILKAASIENKDILKEEYSKTIDNYYENIPFIGLFLNSYIILHTNKLKGDFSGNWYNMFYNIDTWYKIKV